MGNLSHRHHFLPQGSQRLFADERGLVAVVARDGRRFETHPVNIGLERDLYMRERPTGQKTDDIETVSLGTIEQDAYPILQDIESLWPLKGADKLKLATLLGIQLVRGPRWFEWHERFARTNYREYLDRGEFREIGFTHGVSEQEVYEAHVESELDGTRQLLQMLTFGAKAGATLSPITQSSPLLITEIPQAA